MYGRGGKLEGGGQKAQTSHYNISKYQDVMYSKVTTTKLLHKTQDRQGLGDCLRVLIFFLSFVVSVWAGGC